MPAQLPLWAASPAPTRAPTGRRSPDPEVCDCRHAEGRSCGALARADSDHIAAHIMRGLPLADCPGRTTTKRTR